MQKIIGAILIILASGGIGVTKGLELQKYLRELELLNNLMIARTFMENSIPSELLEAARVDGCDDIAYFWKIMLPLSKPVIAVITLYYAVAHWNSYFNAFLYITDSKLNPLQIVLRNILLANQIDTAMTTDFDTMTSKQGLADVLKYSLIVVSTLPVMIMYPFVQKYFTKGVMIGAVKG